MELSVSAFFRLPGPIVTLLGNTWLILAIWTLGGIFILLNANYMAELATMIPKAGGPYVYARRAYGHFAGFVVGWRDWVGNVTAVAFLPIAFAEYAIAPFDKKQVSLTNRCSGNNILDTPSSFVFIHKHERENRTP